MLHRTGLLKQADNCGEAVDRSTYQAMHYLIEVTIPQRLARYAPGYPTINGTSSTLNYCIASTPVSFPDDP